MAGVLTELAPASTQGHSKIRLFSSVNGPYGTVSRDHLPADNALAREISICYQPMIAETYISGKAVLGRKERYASLQEVSANTNQA
ncbi:hypothetical protein IMZ48_33350 [Candidatus Bathyarchaeota archaeon]|nr:hypothetical protein [Candidatus Bathyarchaeota archaeon]